MDDYITVDNLKHEISILKLKNEDLQTKLIDLTFEANHNKQNELIDLVRTLYREVSDEIKDKQSKLTKKEILVNLKNYFEEFAKNNKIKL